MDLIERIRQFQALPTGDSNKDLETWLDLSTNRRAEILAEMPVPFCCSMIAGARVVWPSLEHGKTPEWRTPYRVPGNGYSSAVVLACPFCAATLPKFVLKARPPARVNRSEDDNYCQTCGERNDGCMCSHPLSVYEVEGAPPVFAVMALIRKGKDILTVSRKDNPLDVGLPGGKIDPGETPEQALVREVLEETGLAIHDFYLVFDAIDSTGKRCLTYEVCKHSGEITTKEKGVVKWTTLPDFLAPEHTFVAYNRALIHLVDPYNRHL